MTAITPATSANIQAFGIDGKTLQTALAEKHLQLVDGPTTYYFTILNSQHVSYEAFKNIIDSHKFYLWHPSAVGKLGNGDIKIRFCCGYHACL